MIKYTSSMVVFAEIPDEITLAINVSNCPHRCPGCHSPELQTDIGSDLIASLPELLEKHKDGVTCVCFMGEGNDPDALITCFKMARSAGFKVGLYSGSETAPLDIVSELDYLKLGPYIKEKGGLDNPGTNQKLFRIQNSGIEDVTYRFWKN